MIEGPVLMSDALARRMVNFVGDIEETVRETTAAATRLRAEARQFIDQREQDASREAKNVRRDWRPGNLKNDLEFAYSRMPGKVVRVSQGRARRAPEDAGELRRQYEELLDRATADARAIIEAATEWSTKSKVGRMFGGSAPVPPQSLLDDLATLVSWSTPLADQDQQDARERLAVESAAARERAASGTEELLTEQASRLDGIRAALASSVGSGNRALLPWGHPAWASGQAADRVATVVRLGDYEPRAPFSTGPWSIPAALAFPFTGGLYIGSTTATRAAAVDLARSLCVRLLAAVPPGRLRFTFVDPVSLGQSVADFQHLADFDPLLVDTRPITAARDIETRLAGLSTHLETVISQYLRGQFDSIDAYNEVAGEVAEPYRVLVVFDYPAGFGDAAAQQLLSLIENGPRCGLHTIVVGDEGREQPRDLPLDRLRHGMQRVSWADDRARLVLSDPIGEVAHDVVPDAAPPITFTADGEPASPFAALLVAVGEGSRAAGLESVTLARLLPVLNRIAAAGRGPAAPQLRSGAAVITEDPATWWTGSTAGGAVAPLGRSGAQDLASLYFSSTEIAGGAIMVGLPRSGKTTSLHGAILTMCMTYGPDELELFLIDAKHGVEFKIYEALPHARMVSVHSEREFSVAVLQSLDQEVARRAELMKSRSAGRANISEYRAATGEAMSRIVLIIDEFHEIFEEDDELGHAAFQAFSNIVRQGPFAGIHVVVASQTLSSMPALDRPTLQLLPERVAFMCNESDSDLVMGDLNRGTRLLTRQGQGLFNPARGEPSQNKPFQGLLIEPDERTRILAALARRAREAGWDREARVFDGDAPARRGPVREVDPRRLTVPLGEPLSLLPAVSVTLRRSQGSNVAVVGDVDDDGAATTDLSARGVVHSCLLAATRSGLRARVVDFLGDEASGAYATVADVARGVGAGYHRARDYPSLIAELAATVDKRLADEDYAAPAELLVLFGVQRARAMRPFDPYGETDEDDPAGALLKVLRDGPEVGVHVVVSADSSAALDRRLGDAGTAELMIRAGAATASPADLEFVVSSHRTPHIRRHQLLLGDQIRGAQTRMRAYPPLSRHDLEALERA
jgi:S-DNA-T family DNA segregation ATPase FtsK/SpoIIIE